MSALTPPQVYEPRERSAVVASAVTAFSVLLWAAYILANAEAWRLDGLLLGAAVVASGGAITVVCWYAGQKANAIEHKTLLKRQQTLLGAIAKLHTETAALHREVAELRDDNRRIIAFLQEHANHAQTSAREYDWSAYADGVSDSSPRGGSGASVTPIRPPNGRRPE